MSFFENLLGAAAGYYNQDQAAKAALELGERGAQELSRLGTEVAGMTQFQPFTVTTGLGTATTTPEGGFTLGLSPQQQAMQRLGLTGAQGFMTGVGQDPMQQALLAQASERFAGIGQDPRYQSLLSQADTALSKAMADPTQARADVYQQMRDIQRPEEERQALALEERMLAQGRLGLSSDAYGGASPELLAQEKARQEAMASANLMARQQVAQEQQQEYARGLGLMGQASGMRGQELQEAMGLLSSGYTPQQQQLAAAQTMMGLGYMPQQQALGALGMGAELGKLADIGRRSGAEFFGQAGLGGIEALMQGAELAAGLEAGQRDALTDVFLGSQPTIQQQIAAAKAGMTPQQIQNLGGGGLISSGLNWLSNQLGGTPSTSSALSFPTLPTTQIGQSIPSGVNNIGSYLQGLTSSATGSTVGGMLSTPIVPTSGGGGTTGGSAFPTLPSYSLGQYSTGTPIII